MNYKYAAYLRKSSESRERQALSIKSQKAEILREFPNIDVIEWISEEKSAFKPYKRPKFDQMMKSIYKGKIEGILAWHPDRLSRNEIDAGTFTYAVRIGAIKDLKFVSYNFFNSPEGIKQLQNSLTDSQYSSAKLSIDVKRGLTEKLKMGRMPTVAPIGYLNTKLATRGENKIIVDPKRFKIVRQMWDLMIAGNHSAQQIRDIATEKWGLLTQKKKKIGGRPIGYTSVYNLFSNIFYTGQFTYHGQLYQGDHEPMITMAEYDLVQRRLGEHGTPRPKTHSFAYGCGTFKCGECYYPIISIEKIKYIKTENLTRVYNLYYCGNTGKVVSCGQHKHLNEIELEKQLKVELFKYTIDPEFLHWALEVMKDNNVAEVVTEKDIKESVIKTIESKQGELNKLIQMAMKGFISDEEFKSSRAELDVIIHSLKSQLKITESDKEQDLTELTEKAFVYSTYALIALQNGDKQTRKEVVKSLGLNRTIKDKKLNVVAFEWYDAIRKGYFNIKEILARIEPEFSCKQRSIYDFPTLCSVLRGRWVLSPRPLS